MWKCCSCFQFQFFSFSNKFTPPPHACRSTRRMKDQTRLCVCLFVRKCLYEFVFAFVLVCKCVCLCLCMFYGLKERRVCVRPMYASKLDEMFSNVPFRFNPHYMSRILLFAFEKIFAKKQNICHTSLLFVVSLILQLQFYRLKIRLV